MGMVDGRWSAGIYEEAYYFHKSGKKVYEINPHTYEITLLKNPTKKKYSAIGLTKKGEVKRRIERKGINMRKYSFTKLIKEGVSNNDLKSYLETALRSSTDDNGNPLDEIADLNRISKEVKLQAKKDLNKFYSKAKGLIKNGDYEGDWPHDFWLTRNGHGAGFWDNSSESGDELTKIADKFSEVNLYVGDDGYIYQM